MSDIILFKSNKEERKHRENHDFSVLTKLLIILTPFIFYAGFYTYSEVKGARINSTIEQGNTLTNGLVGYWTFNGDDIAGTTAYDRSGQGNNGTIGNSPSKVPGKLGQALNFWPNGSDTNAYVSMGDPVSGVLDFGTNDFTISIWTKNTGYVNQGSARNAFVSKQNMSTCGAGYSLSFTATGVPNFHLTDTNCTNSATVSHTERVDDDRWHMITGVRSGNMINVAVDGVFTTAVSVASVGSISNTRPFVVSDQGEIDGLRNIRGAMDEVYVYNRALSASEVNALYSVGQAKISKSNTANMEGLVGWWTFDGDDTNWSSSTAEILDASGNRNNGNASNLTSKSAVIGKTGQSLQFNGSNTYVDILTRSFTGPFTFMTWFKTTNINQTGIIFGETNGGSGGGPKIGVVTGKLFARVISSSDNQVAVPTDENWHFFAISRDSDNKIDLSVDGGTPVRLFSDVAQAGTFNLTNVGANGGDNSQNFSGVLDDIKIYDRALSANEMRQIYTESVGTEIANNQTDKVTNGLVGYWSFNGGDFTDKVYDRSGQGNHGYVMGTASSSLKVSGRIGQGVRFPGINSVSMRMLSGTSIDNISALTFTAWIKPEDGTYGPRGFIALKGHASQPPDSAPTYYSGWSVGFNSDNPTKFFFGVDYQTTNLYRYANASTFTENEWQFLTVTWDGSTNATGIKIYRNGIEAAYGSSQNGSGARVDDAIYDLIIANDSYSGDNFYGYMDEVRVYDRVLSVDEIQQLYEQGM